MARFDNQAKSKFMQESPYNGTEQQRKGSITDATGQCISLVNEAEAVNIKNEDPDNPVYVGFDAEVDTTNDYLLEAGMEKAFPVSVSNIYFKAGAGITISSVQVIGYRRVN